MSKITTENCKDFIIEYFNSKGVETKSKDWKRTSKYKENDLWIRDFSHPAIGSISLVEKNDVLEIKNNNNIQEEKQEVSYFKKFTKDEVNAAKKLIKKLIKLRTDGEDEDELYESNEWKTYQHAIPSQFTFYFPFDTPHEIYHNDRNNVTNGLDSPLVFNTYESFNIMFNDKNTDDIDLYTSDCLNNGILPTWTDFIDEYHLEATSEAPKNITVKDFIKILFDLGFDYKVGEEYDCLFNKEIKNYISELKTNSKNKDSNIEKESFNTKSILELNKNLHHLDDIDSVKKEFKKYSNQGDLFKTLEKEFTNSNYDEDDLPYSLENSKIFSDIPEIQKNIRQSFIYSVYEVYSGETSIEISDIYGLCGGDNGQTVGLILDGENGLIKYLENNNYEIAGFSECSISVETEDHVSLSKKLEDFGLTKYNPKIHTDAYIMQEPIEEPLQYQVWFIESSGNEDYNCFLKDFDNLSDAKEYRLEQVEKEGWNDDPNDDPYYSYAKQYQIIDTKLALKNIPTKKNKP